MSLKYFEAVMEAEEGSYWMLLISEHVQATASLLTLELVEPNALNAILYNSSQSMILSMNTLAYCLVLSSWSDSMFDIIIRTNCCVSGKSLHLRRTSQRSSLARNFT